MSDRHTSAASATFKPYYMICYYGLNSSNLVPKFVDHANTQRAYCRGEVIDFSRTKIMTEKGNTQETINIRFVSVWQ